MKTNNDISCCVVSCEKPLDATYWDAQWKSNTTGWDLGIPSPPLVHFINKIEDKNAAILIPGCGNAYEAEYLLEQGFKNITLIDISETASQLLKDKFSHRKEIKVLCEDFFMHQGLYEIILEQTFFCALPPSWRQRYVWKMHQLLHENGILAGLLFNRTFEQGPPFGGSQEEYEQLFQKAFILSKLTLAKDSIAPRANTELAFEFKKNKNVETHLYSFEGITCTGCKNTVSKLFLEIEGVENVGMSSDFKEVLIVSKNEIPLDLLQEKIAYDSHYTIKKI